VLDVGVTAPYLLTSLLLPLFQPGASVVNIASTRAFQSQADTESYSAAKGGILALTHALAVSLAHRVRVNAVSPGWIDTTAWQGMPVKTGGGNLPALSLADAAQHPANRVGQPADIVRTVMYLCHPDNSFVTGQNLTVDGGMSVQMVYHGDEGWRYVPTQRD
jgi:NAD(P)-dependent dehydrogenase (short-subunit alcohol dehydrogenase family)